MSIVWPVTLPQKPLFADHEEALPKTAVETAMDIGEPKVRQRSTAGVGNVSYGYKLTATQLATFLTFFTTTTAGGSLTFEWEHPQTAETETWQFVASSPPRWRQTGRDVFYVTFPLRILP